jgi:hypothetical protein
MRGRYWAAAGCAAILVGVVAVPAVRADGSSDLAARMADLRSTQAGTTVWSAGDPLAPGAAGIDVASLPVGAKSVQRVVLAAGCRVFDTRGGTSPGPIAAGSFKDFSMLDANTAAQGGNGSGCGIPADAVAVDLSISTVGTSPTAAGYLRAGPGGTAPTATVLQFLKGQGTSVTTSVLLSGADAIRVAAFTGSTNVVGDVLAYYRGVLHATVDSDGLLFKGNGVASVVKYEGGLGQYYVNFDRDISECVPAISGAFGLAAWGLLLDSDTVGVVVVDWAGTATDGPFHVVVSC